MLKVIISLKSGTTKEHVLVQNNKITTKGIIVCMLDALCDIGLVAMTWKIAKIVYKKK
ncbi:MAG: hypothetical protein MJ087_05615 [Lachnospiraceae bacterium]|nr:hypothetical protein [Lachnospiraceae bacterium]